MQEPMIREIVQKKSYSCESVENFKGYKGNIDGNEECKSGSK
jgi:hypothetical protein